MSDSAADWRGPLALMVLQTLATMGPLSDDGLARRVEQISEAPPFINHGTLYPVLLRLEQEGFVTSEWVAAEDNRQARCYRLTPAGRRQLARETREWEQIQTPEPLSPAEDS